MTYEISCRQSVQRDDFVFFVVLRIGATVYKGETDYTTFRAAVRAAKRTGAKAA